MEVEAPAPVPVRGNRELVSQALANLRWAKWAPSSGNGIRATSILSFSSIQTNPTLASDIEPGALFVRLTQNLVRLLQECTPDGYVFRVDFALAARSGLDTDCHLDPGRARIRHERRGQNWERSAMIKARVCAGDLAAGNKFLSELSPFVWRKYMDYAALADIHAMKRQIHAYKGHGEIGVAGHNIKLGRGGIREIEFFVQTQQLIAGGRHPILRERETLKTLRFLADGGWISAEAEQDLRAAIISCVKLSIGCK